VINQSFLAFFGWRFYLLCDFGNHVTAPDLDNHEFLQQLENWSKNYQALLYQELPASKV
jgi:chromosome condensin MukBEF MukE localization factor